MTKTDKDEYDISELTSKLDNTLELEGITVTESLIQATLQKANEQKKEEHLILQDTNTQINHRISKKRVISFGTFAACAACFAILILSNIENKKSFKESYKACDDATTENNAMDCTGETDKGISQESMEDAKVDNTNILTVVTDTEPILIDKDKINDIEITDEKGNVIKTINTRKAIETIYNTLENLQGEVLVNDISEEGQSQFDYSREYCITMKDGYEVKKLYIWIPITLKEETTDDNTLDLSLPSIERQIVMKSGECSTQIITNVNQEQLDKILKSIPQG